MQTPMQRRGSGQGREDRKAHGNYLRRGLSWPGWSGWPTARDGTGIAKLLMNEIERDIDADVGIVIGIGEAQP